MLAGYHFVDIIDQNLLIFLPNNQGHISKKQTPDGKSQHGRNRRLIWGFLASGMDLDS